jgi:transposase-like protein
MKLIDFFTKDLSPKQKQYEAIRAVAFGEGPIKEVAKKFGYTPQTLRTFIHQLRTAKLQIFPLVKKGPVTRRISPETVKLIIQLRRQEMLNSREIAERLGRSNRAIGVRTVERVLIDAGFPKLRRRTDKERGLSKAGTVIPKRSEQLSKKLHPFRIECQVAGLFFFLPYIIDSGILDIVSQCELPQSSDIGKLQAALSMLALKLIGNERLSHIRQYDTDIGFGLFAGLNVLPKPTYMCSYSCRTEASALLGFQQKIIGRMQSSYPELYSGQTINLDFHSIPHFGADSEMDNVWCGARGKTLKGANCFFAQDGESDSLLYSRADIKRSESSGEIKQFVDYWMGIKGVVEETLVFDSKLTTYEMLGELAVANIKFITLRTRSKRLIEETLKIPEEQWQKVYLPIPKRKYKDVKVHESTVTLVEGQKPFRQVIVKDHGRAEPTFIISNNPEIKSQALLIIYAKRWHIENKLADIVHFFNANALSSPIMIRIHFDLLWTLIADTLYHLFAKDLRRFEKCTPQKIFKQFVDMPGQVVYDGNCFTIKIRKRAMTPILLGVEKLKKEIHVPWLNNKPLKIVWTP